MLSPALTSPPPAAQRRRVRSRGAGPTSACEQRLLTPGVRGARAESQRSERPCRLRGPLAKGWGAEETASWSLRTRISSRVASRSALSSTVSSRPDPGPWSPRAGAAAGTHGHTLRRPGRGHTVLSRLCPAAASGSGGGCGGAGSSSAERGGVDPNGRRGEAAGCPWVSAPGGCGHGVDRCNRGLLREGGGNAGKTKEKGSALWGPRRHGTSPRGRDGLPEPRAGALGPPSDGTVRETARNAPLGVLELRLPDRQATLRIRLHGDSRRGRRRRAAQRPSASRMLAAHGSAGRSGDRVARPPEDLTPTCPRLERHLLCRKHSRTRSPRAHAAHAHDARGGPRGWCRRQGPPPWPLAHASWG